MPLIKLGESVVVEASEFKEYSALQNDPAILERFKKFAAELKSIAPKAKDFLYFSAIMLHAAEASALNSDGTIKVGSNGKPVTVGWDNSGNTWRWVTSDKEIQPYRNSNRDVFPESELIKAHKLWVGRPLCLDHKSSSVDFIRGVIVDTYYDPQHKRVIGLCALDKINYPDLARKVSTGYATSVSMGTAVGRAICSTCANVAKVEADFCDHMRSRECYGEINVDLTPIELSIVVNGADPQAKIRHIVAASNSITQYLDMRSKDLQKMSQSKELNMDELSTLKKEVDSIAEKLAKLENTDQNDVSAPYGATSGTLNMTETDLPAVQPSGSSGPVDLTNVIASIHTKLDRLQNDIMKLSQNKEINMATEKKAYFQGGGDVNEPAPKEVKYEKEDSDKIRDTEDGQMGGCAPFPDTGPVDGIHPGYPSFGETEEARKKRLQRAAEANDRAVKRAEALTKAKANLEKAGYYQNGEGDKSVNTPTPGKPKYEKEVDKHNEDDKHLDGQSPFPGVGAVDGLHPSPESADVKDELKRKEMLSRASLKAKFVKAANPDGTENLGSGRWDVYAGDKLLLSATVDELSRKNSEAMYAGIATKDFGMKILETIKSAGFDKAKALFKGAQEVAAPGALPAAAPDMGGPGAMPTGLGEVAPVDESAANDPAKRAQELVDKVRDAASDLGETINVLTGEGKELSDTADLGTQASSLHMMRKALNEGLLEGMKEVVEELASHEDELKLVASIYTNGKIAKASSEDKTAVASLTKDAFEHTNRVLADSYKLLAAFCKYARGTEYLLNGEVEKTAQTAPLPVAPPPASTTDVKPVVQNPTPEDLKSINPKVEPMDTDKLLNKLNNIGTDVHHAADSDEDKTDTNEVNVDLNADQMKKVLEDKTASSPDLATKEGRAEYRAKLAQKGVEWSDMIQKAHPKGGATISDLDTKSNEAKFETITEKHDAIMEVATQATPKVKKAAEDIQRAIVTGKLAAEDVESLVAHGLDGDAVKYWKQFYAQAPDGGSEFAAALVKEHAKAKLDDEKNAFQVKIARAYELANEMADRGMISREGGQIKNQVEEIMNFNDAGFESLKKVVARYAPRGLTKEASIPSVGLISGDVIMPRAYESTDLKSELEAMFDTKKRY